MTSVKNERHLTSKSPGVEAQSEANVLPGEKQGTFTVSRSSECRILSMTCLIN